MLILRVFVFSAHGTLASGSEACSGERLPASDPSVQVRTSLITNRHDSEISMDCLHFLQKIEKSRKNSHTPLIKTAGF